MVPCLHIAPLQTEKKSAKNIIMKAISPFPLLPTFFIFFSFNISPLFFLFSALNSWSSSSNIYSPLIFSSFFSRSTVLIHFLILITFVLLLLLLSFQLHSLFFLILIFHVFLLLLFLFFLLLLFLLHFACLSTRVDATDEFHYLAEVRRVA